MGITNICPFKQERKYSIIYLLRHININTDSIEIAFIICHKFSYDIDKLFLIEMSEKVYIPKHILFNAKTFFF